MSIIILYYIKQDIVVEHDVVKICTRLYTGTIGILFIICCVEGLLSHES